MANIHLHTFNPMDHGLRVRWVLAELNQSAEMVEHDFSELTGKEFSSLNPFQRIPVLEIDGQPIYESGAICWWLAQHYEADFLLLPDHPDFAQMLQWVFVATSYLDVAAMRFAISNRQQADASIIDRYKMDLQRELQPLEDHLNDRKWLLGEQFTLADILLLYPLALSSVFDALNGFPVLKRYVRSFLARAAAKEFVEISRHWHCDEG